MSLPYGVKHYLGGSSLKTEIIKENEKTIYSVSELSKCLEKLESDYKNLENTEASVVIGKNGSSSLFHNLKSKNSVPLLEVNKQIKDIENTPAAWGHTHPEDIAVFSNQDIVNSINYFLRYNREISEIFVKANKEFTKIKLEDFDNNQLKELKNYAEKNLTQKDLDNFTLTITSIEELQEFVNSTQNTFKKVKNSDFDFKKEKLNDFQLEELNKVLGDIFNQTSEDISEYSNVIEYKDKMNLKFKNLLKNTSIKKNTLTNSIYKYFEEGLNQQILKAGKNRPSDGQEIQKMYLKKRLNDFSDQTGIKIDYSSLFETQSDENFNSYILNIVNNNIKSQKDLREEVEKTNDTIKEQSKIISGDSLKGVGLHATAAQYDVFDFNKSKANQLGAGMYLTDQQDAAKFVRSKNPNIKQVEFNLEKCFVLTKDYISSISDINEILQTSFVDNTSPKEVLSAIRNYNRSSKENSANFRQKMLEKGYQGFYVSDYLANKQNKNELVIYDESKLDKIISFTHNEFEELTHKNAEFTVNIDEQKLKKTNEKLEEESFTIEKIIDLFKILTSYISNISKVKNVKSVSKFFDGIKDGTVEVNDELLGVMQKLNLLNNGEYNFNSITQGFTNFGGLINDSFTLIARDVSVEEKTNSLIDKLKEAQKQGVALGTIIGTIKDEEKGVIYEIQSTISGENLNIISKYFSLFNFFISSLTSDENTTTGICFNLSSVLIILIRRCPESNAVWEVSFYVFLHELMCGFILFQQNVAFKSKINRMFAN